MSTKDAASIDGAGETVFTYSAVAVCEHTGKPPSSAIVPLQFHARHTALPPSLLFTFYVGTEPYTTPCLRIPPDCIASLSRTQHGKSSPGAHDSPPCIDLVRQQFGNPRLTLSRLQFRLRSHGYLEQPAGAIPTPGQQHADTAAAITTFAAATVFSVYLPHDALPRVKYNIFYLALQPYLDAQRPDRTPAAPAYTATRNAQGNDAVSTPTDSDNDTVAVTTPSGFGQPADDDDNHIPGYNDSQDQVLASGPQIDAVDECRLRSSGDDKVDSCRRPAKRGRLSPGAAALAEYESTSPPTDTYHHNSRLDALERYIRMQDERIARVEAQNVHLLGQNKTLGERVERLEADNRHLVQVNKKIGERIEELECNVLEIDELESRVDQIAEEQDRVDNAITMVEVQYGELDEDCGRIERQLAAIQGDAQDELYDGIQDRAKEAVDTIVDEHLQGYMDEKVREFQVEFKRKLRDLLQD